jgi:hypothetical protein
VSRKCWQPDAPPSQERNRAEVVPFYNVTFKRRYPTGDGNWEDGHGYSAYPHLASRDFHMQLSYAAWCGEINVKNALGGYTGFQKFAARDKRRGTPRSPRKYGRPHADGEAARLLRVCSARTVSPVPRSLVGATIPLART